MLVKLNATAARIMASYGDLEDAAFFDDPLEVSPEERELWHAAQDVSGPCSVELSADAATQLWAEVENELHQDSWCETRSDERRLAAYRGAITKTLLNLESQGVKPFVHVADAD